MKNELKLPFYLAFQSIRRGRKWTFFLTILLMSVAFINLIFITALFNGIVEGSNRQIINTLTGNVYLSPKQGVDFLNNRDSILKDVRDTEGVQAATAGFSIPARIEKDSRTGRWPVVAINPDEYSSVFNISDKMAHGKYLQANDTDGIILGRQIAGGEGVEMNSTSLKGANVGDQVVVAFDGFEKTFTVRGIFYTKFIESDARAFITQKALNNIMPISKNRATVINVRTSDANEAKVHQSLQTIHPDAEAFLWTEAAGLMKSVSSSFLSIDILMTMVGVIIAAVTVFIVIYVDIVNRRRQIGILRAIGIKSYIIVFNYVILAAVYASLGILLGSLVYFAALVPYFNIHPFSLPITDATLNLPWSEYIKRLEIISWVAALSGLIPAIIVVKAKMLDEIQGR